MYVAHLHFEIRKNLRIGINQGSYRRDLSNYFKPYDFIIARRNLPGGNRRVRVPLDTFRLQARVVDTTGGGSTSRPETPSGQQRRGDFRINRYGETAR
jgi:hypothetical protein